MTRFITGWCLPLLLLALACQPKSDGVAPSAPNGASTGADTTRADPTRGDSLLTITGTVHHLELEGGFWTIRGDDGTTYDPLASLTSEFQQEGLRVRARVRPRDDVMSTHQAGRIVEIVEITKQ